MKKILLIFLILTLFPVVNADPVLTDSETKNGFTVEWYIVRDGISRIEYIINITNLYDIKRNINLSTIFEPQTYQAGAIKNIKFLEYEEIKDTNSGNIIYKWSESKPLFINSNIKTRKDSYATTNIGKSETKTFFLSFEVPISNYKESYGSSTKFFLGINNITYHPWYNISWFNRLYLYDIDPTGFLIVKRISIDTRSLWLQHSINEDCTDLRITDTDNTELEYNLVSGCLTSNTTLDIEFTANLTDMYIYYNNPDAGNVSNYTVVIMSISPNNIIDDSGNENTGNATNISWATGVYGGIGIEFDGVTSHINVSDSTSLRIDGNMSLFMWVNLNNVTSTQRFIRKRYLTETHWDFYIYEGKLGNSNGTTSANDLEPLIIDQWYYIGYVIKDNIITYYINGTEKTSHNFTLTSDNASIMIGIVPVADPGGGSAVNGTMDEVRIYNRSLSLSEIVNIYNGSELIDDTDLQLYYSFNSTDLYPTYEFESQSYSPFYASEQSFEGISNLAFLAPVESSIYAIYIDLDNCPINHFSIETNTFKFYGNVTRTLRIAKTWDVCLSDKINITTICKKMYGIIDPGKTQFKYGQGSGGKISEWLHTKYQAFADAYIHFPREFRQKEDGTEALFTGNWFLAFPNNVGFNSSCPDNNARMFYQRDESLKDVIDTAGVGSNERGILELLSDFKSGTITFLSLAWDITSFGFSFVIFLISHIWLVFIMFEMFAMAYSLKTTYTISEYLGTYVNIHVEGLKLVIDLFNLLFSFIQRIITTITNLFPF